MRNLVLIAAAIACGVIVACGGDGGGTSSCVPGQTAACTCTDGSSGAQTCSASGIYGACTCTGGGGTGGTGGGGGSTGPVCLNATEACASGGTCCNGMACWQANGITDCLPKAGQSCYTNQYATATNVAANGGYMECCNTKGGTAGTGAFATSCTCNTCGGQNGAQGGCKPSGGPGQTCGPCNIDADCAIGEKCNKPSTGTGNCVAACASVGKAPTSTLSCCDGLIVDAANVCLLPTGATCLSDADCKSHVCNRTTTDATCG